MTTDELVIISNIVLSIVTLIASLVTIVEIHKDDQKTLRMVLFGRFHVPLPPKRGKRGKHE